MLLCHCPKMVQSYSEVGSGRVRKTHNEVTFKNKQPKQNKKFLAQPPHPTLYYV